MRDPDLVREACRLFPGRVAVGIDARGGKVAVEGWAETSELAAVDLARRFEDAGVAAIIYTDIDRDGVLKGLNLPATAGACRAPPPSRSSPPAASPVSTTARRCCSPSTRMLEGAITGRALYDGRLDARAALALLSGSDSMNSSWEKASMGFGERGQEPFGDIPTEPEAFLRWGAQRSIVNQPYKFELSTGTVSRTMIWHLAGALARERKYSG